MKWKTKILSLLCALLVMGACAPSRPSVDPASILIVYYSHTGHTQEAAGEIRDRTGGTLAQIIRQQPYEDLYTQAEAEITNGERPAISLDVENVEEYDVIFVGYPIWWEEAPAMIATFLSSYDLSGKVIIPFCTSASDPIDTSVHIFDELCPDAQIEEGFEANSSEEIQRALSDLGLLREA